jgi:heme/copper-type cytochrome/quinol oxidase subunit 3
MIQRIQSVYLLIIFLISNLMLFVNPRFASFRQQDNPTKVSVEVNYITHTTYNASDNGVSTQKLLNLVIIVALGLGSLLNVFLYKNTALQKRICIYIVLASAILLGILFFDYYNIANQRNSIPSYPGFHLVWPIVSAVFGFLAWNAIRRDEDLIKGMDRIR